MVISQARSSLSPGLLPKVLPDPDGDILENVFRVVPVAAEPSQQPHGPRSVPVDKVQEGFTVRGHGCAGYHQVGVRGASLPPGSCSATSKTGVCRKVFDPIGGRPGQFGGRLTVRVAVQG